MENPCQMGTVVKWKLGEGDWEKLADQTLRLPTNITLRGEISNLAL